VIEGYSFGFAAGEGSMWCIHRDDIVGRMLCGRRVGHIPVPQPQRPKNVHRDCLEAMYGQGERAPSRDEDFGVCPVCGGEAAVFGGRLQRHGAWRVRGGEVYVSMDRCLGEGEPPVEET
jgi:hypothetical protein